MEEYLGYCDRALVRLGEIATELGDDLVGARLDDVPGSNSAFGLLSHCIGVMGRWARQVNRGIPVPRDRDAEFRATGTVAEILLALSAARDRLHEDAFAASPREPPADPPTSEDVPDPPPTQGDILLHVYEELAQHLGQLEVTRDVLLVRAARRRG